MELFLEIEDDMLYINTENGSGAKYKITDRNKIGELVQNYIDIYVDWEA